MAGITASVGIHNGKPCYNVLEDQKTITNLLNAIPRSQGGAEGSLPAPTSWGIVSSSLHQAILTFQRWHKLSVDGHIDPKGSAIGLLNRLAGSSAGGLSGGALGTSESRSNVS